MLAGDDDDSHDDDHKYHDYDHDHEYHDYDNDDEMIIAAAECVRDFQNFSRLLSFDNSFTLAWSVTFDFVLILQKIFYFLLFFANKL